MGALKRVVYICVCVYIYIDLVSYYIKLKFIINRALSVSFYLVRKPINNPNFFPKCGK